MPLGDIDPESFRRKDINVDELAEIYRELEFRSFLNRLGMPATASAPAPAPAPVEGEMGSLFDFQEENQAVESINSQGHNYKLITTAAEAAEMVERMNGSERISIAVNASGEFAMTAKLEGIAFSNAKGFATYIAFPAAKVQREEIAVVLQPLFDKAPLIVSHNIKRDLIVLRREKMILGKHYYDTSVAHYLIDPEMKHELAYVSRKYLNYSIIEPEPAPPGRPPKNQPGMSREEAATKFGEQADITLRLYDELTHIIKEQDLEPLLTSIEMPLVRVLAEMEWNGVRIDVMELSRLDKQFTERLRDMEQKIFQLAGGPFNISSPMQVGEVLFDRLKIDTNAKRTKKGGYSTTEEILEKLRAANPIVDLILQYRALKKLLTTYVKALPAMVNPVTGKIHTSFNQTVTATGRISSTNPNLQNIPIRSDDGREIRCAFIPEPGDLLLSADYSQIELRLMAVLSHDKDMIDAFLSGEDIHRATAAKVYHEAIEDVTDTQRRNAKTANFGIIYGISAFGLSERLGIPRAEAKMLIDGYFRTYPGVKEYMNSSIEYAREHGFVATLKGRKRFLPDINSRSAVVRGYAERNAINAPLQGSAADIIKLAMVEIDRHMTEAGLQSKMILQVHDELVFNVKPEELPKLQEIVVRDMEGAFSAVVPLTVSSGTGMNWLEAH